MRRCASPLTHELRQLGQGILHGKLAGIRVGLDRQLDVAMAHDPHGLSRVGEVLDHA